MLFLTRRATLEDEKTGSQTGDGVYAEPDDPNCPSEAEYTSISDVHHTQPSTSKNIGDYEQPSCIGSFILGKPLPKPPTENIDRGIYVYNKESQNTQDLAAYVYNAYVYGAEYKQPVNARGNTVRKSDEPGFCGCMTTVEAQYVRDSYVAYETADNDGYEIPVSSNYPR